MTSKEKINDILDWVQNTMEVNWSFMACLKQDLKDLVVIAQDEAWDNNIKE